MARRCRGDALRGSAAVVARAAAAAVAVGAAAGAAWSAGAEANLLLQPTSGLGLPRRRPLPLPSSHSRQPAPIGRRPLPRGRVGRHSRLGVAPRPAITEWEDVELLPTLPEATEDILRRLRERRPQIHDKVQDHELPPLLPKVLWTHLGKLVKAQEEYATTLPGDRWISLRLDGCCWGTLTGELREAGYLGPGFSDGIADAMQASCCAVLREFGGVLGYTHSDEFSVLVPPARQEELAHGGSCTSWTSIAASVASAEFNRRLVLLARDFGGPLNESIVAHFDCRAGSFGSAAEALALILWRANDCNMNSASDAIKFSDAPMTIRGFNTIQKLQYLQERGMLPLRRHQAYGSLFVASGEADAKPVLANDGAGGQPRHVMNLVRIGSLVPERWLSPADLEVLKVELDSPGDLPESPSSTESTACSPAAMLQGRYGGP